MNYHIGNKIRIYDARGGYCGTYLLASIRDNHVILVHVDQGVRWCPSLRVRDQYALTDEDVERLVNRGRYHFEWELYGSDS